MALFLACVMRNVTYRVFVLNKFIKMKISKEYVDCCKMPSRSLLAYDQKYFYCLFNTRPEWLGSFCTMLREKCTCFKQNY